MCRSRRELSNEYLLAKFGFDTAEKEPWKVGREPESPDCNRDYVRYHAPARGAAARPGFSGIQARFRGSGAARKIRRGTVPPKERSE